MYTFCNIFNTLLPFGLLIIGADEITAPASPRTALFPLGGLYT
jgi:hypothetical protein